MLLSDLENDDWPVRLLAFRMLVPESVSRQRIRELFLAGAESVRESTVQPLAGDRGSRDILCESVQNRRGAWETVVSILRNEPRVKNILREQVRDDAVFLNLVRSHNFEINHVARGLKDDPEAHPLLLERARESKDGNVVAAIVPALANYPTARPFLRQLLIDEARGANVTEQAASALAGDAESKIALCGLLKQEGLCRARVQSTRP